MPDAVNAMISVGLRPTRSEKRPHIGALTNCATVNELMMKPVMMPTSK